MRHDDKPRCFTFSILSNDKHTLPLINFYGKGNKSKGIRLMAKDIISLRQQNKELEDTVNYLNSKLLPEGSEETVVRKALGLDYPDDCYDMISINGDPTKRRCICPPSQRPVSIPLVKGEYIVDNPRICRRCKALDYRKPKENSKSKPTQSNPRKTERDRVFCKRDQVWTTYGDKNCLTCTWLTSECSVKRRMLKEA